MSHHEDDLDIIVPAHLDHLNIYSPDLALAGTDEKDQVLFDYSRAADWRPYKDRRNEASDGTRKEEDQGKMRRIGLAQGMVNCAR